VVDNYEHRYGGLSLRQCLALNRTGFVGGSNS
jgi:hypothetical protein